MDKIENLQKYFQEFGCTVEDNRVLDKCTQLCDLYDVDEEKFVEMWLGYSTSTYNEVDISLNRLVKMEHDLLKKQDQSNSINKTGEFSNANSVIDSSYKQIETDSILEMYGCEGVTASTTTMSKRLRSPDLLENEDTKIRAVDSQFFPLSYAPRSDTSVRCRVNPDSGKVILFFGKEISSWNRESNYDVNIIPKSETVPSNILYMYELLRTQQSIIFSVCYNIGKRLCNMWSKSDPTNILYTQNVTYQSQTNFRTWGRILCDSHTKSDITSYMLEGCKSSYDGYKAATISLNLDGVKQYSLYPGQIVAVEGTNPTNSIFHVKQFFTKGYAIKSEPPKLTKNLNIIVAAGPFTSSDNLCYQPLFNIMERVAKEEPHILILIGPFIEKSHPHIKNCKLMETFLELFERLLVKAMQYLLGKSVKLVIIPSHLDAHHFAVFPTPGFHINKDKLPQNGENIYMMSDPSIMDIEGLIIGVTSVDSIKHISKEEISNFPATDRLIRIADHILSQCCFYPFYPPSVNLDTKMWKKHAFFNLQPHILILPSDMRYFCGVINDCLVINPERSIKQMYARLCIRPSEQWNPHNISCEIGKI
ncbi:PREDICTED: DNA polymerase alpha subunit B isoform X1 [Polistes canadensis]|uniref:DNA polymerase alpha subunit B isoform X1 n=1 Tax=Polistes canadensis TaxID=91411 RepID=UPI000718E416|nr:PREDICTED: DNA polymerase alpha subunit B isoform X1 [Polistes canadensis]